MSGEKLCLIFWNKKLKFFYKIRPITIRYISLYSKHPSSLEDKMLGFGDPAIHAQKLVLEQLVTPEMGAAVVKAVVVILLVTMLALDLEGMLVYSNIMPNLRGAVFNFWSNVAKAVAKATAKAFAQYGNLTNLVIAGIIYDVVPFFTKPNNIERCEIKVYPKDLQHFGVYEYCTPEIDNHILYLRQMIWGILWLLYTARVTLIGFAIILSKIKSIFNWCVARFA